MPDWKSENRRAEPVDGRSAGHERPDLTQPEQTAPEHELPGIQAENEQVAAEASTPEPVAGSPSAGPANPARDVNRSLPEPVASDEADLVRPDPPSQAPPPSKTEPAEPPREAEPVAVASAPPPPPRPEPVSAPPAILPSQTVSAPPVPPEVVHPPVPADRLPPSPEDERKPFYKRDISFRRTKKAAGPDPVGQSPVNEDERKPFYKRDLSFPRTKKESERVALPEEEGERKPFYKRELSFGRKQGSKAEAKPTKHRRPERAGGRGKGGKSLVGLKVGASQIAAAQVANNGYAELIQVAREPLAPGIVVGGELREPDALSAALKAFFSKHKLPKRAVRLGIATNRIGVRAFEISGIADPRQLDNAIRFRAQDALPIPIEEAVLDYQILDEAVNEEGELVRRVLLVVVYRELVDRYVGAFRKAGINLAGIDLEGFALLRSLQAPRDHADGDAALVAVTIGHERSTFAVSDGRRCEFTRVLDWGGSALNVAIARALDLSPTEAEPIKLALSLAGNETPAGLSEDRAAAAREAVARQIEAFARELVSSLQFYQNQPGSLGIGEIAITGGTAHLNGLAEELQRLIGVTVRVGNPLGRVKVGKKLGEPEQVGSLAVAIGLGIED
jgi:type IV pilus assembly protein PilM